MPEDDQISSKRIMDALLDDEREMVRKMLDPHVSTEPATFEQIYARMRKELKGDGQKPVEVVTDAPAPAPEQLSELGMGALETGQGYTRGGAFGHSAWSGYNPRNKDMDGDNHYQQMLRSPSTRMLDMTNPGVPDSHTPGEFLDQHLDDPDDPDRERTIKDPTDLSDMIIRRIRRLK